MNEKKKTKKSYYFNEDVDKAIVDFQKAQTIKEKNTIFEKSIMPAFEKLVSFHYMKYPVARNEEIKHDCLVDLYEKINNFNSEKYTRAFPYFNMISRNFFIQELLKQKKQVKDGDFIISFTENFESDEFAVDVDNELEEREFLDIFFKNLEEWKEFFKKENDKIVIDGLITLFENSENFSIYNRKAIYFYLREITGLNSKQIALTLSKLKKKFSSLKKNYQKGNI